MRVQVLWVLAVGLLLGADKVEDKKEDKKEDAAKELKKFEGKWVAVSREENGKKASGSALKGFTLTAQGNKLTLIDGRRTSAGSFTLDLGKTPKQIDITGQYGGREIKLLGIYAFDGDKLKVCYAGDGGERPKKFSSKGGTADSPVIFTVYKKAKKPVNPKSDK
jgi:uncharacterized protein (TIGR03067 family)